MTAIFTYLLFFLSNIALGAEPSPVVSPEAVVTAAQSGLAQEGASWLQLILSSWPDLGKFVAFLIALQIFLRGLAEALTRISELTDTATDNKVAGWISEAAWLLGVVVGKLGYGVPTLVIAEKAEQLAAKKSPSAEGPQG